MSYESRIEVIMEMNAFGKVRYGVRVDGRELHKDLVGNIVQYGTTYYSKTLRFRSRNAAMRAAKRFLKKNSWRQVHPDYLASITVPNYEAKVYETKPRVWEEEYRSAR